MELRADLLPLFAIGGGVLFLIANRLAFIVRYDGLAAGSSWWLWFSGAGVGFLAGRIVQRGATSDAVVVLGAQLELGFGFFMAATGAASLRSLAGLRDLSWRVRALFGLAIVHALATLATDWTIAPPIEIQRDLFDRPRALPDVRPATVVALIAMAILVALEARALHRLRPAIGRTGRLRSVALVFVVLACNDVLFAAGALPTIQLFEYAFVFLALMSTHFELARMLAVRDRLELLVAQRTAGLEAERASLVLGEARFRQLADATREAVLVCVGGHIVDANRAALDLFDPELIGRGAGELIAPADRARFDAYYQRGGGGLPLELDVLDHGGQPIRAALRTSVDPVQPERRVVLIRDIRDELQIQRKLLQSDRLAALGTLAAGTAHEINNPLAYVLGNAETLRDLLATEAPPAAELRTLVGEILHGGYRVRAIVGQLGALSRERPADDGPTDLRAAVEDVLVLTSHQLRHRARIRVEIPELPPVRGDRVRIGQVLLNLIVNALQSIPTGHAGSNEVAIRAWREGNAVHVLVTDTGCGIDPELVERIFDPFFTTKAIGDGSGLGLSICHSIVTGLGGRIDVASTRGQGSAFTIVLPLADRPATPTGRPIPGSPRTGEPPGRLSILLIDDEPMVARALARMLRDHDVELVSDAETALDRCLRGDHDAIVCDLMMPDRSGIEIHALLEREAPERAARMLFVTGGAFSNQAQAFLAERPERCLEKPVVVGELRAAVGRVTGRELGNVRGAAGVVSVECAASNVYRLAT
ncbi:MAG: ATP-binding protein [Kofleriaceae bacterium]